MDYEEMERVLDELNTSKKSFADQLGTYPHNINRWAHSKVPGYVELALDGLRYRQQQKGRAMNTTSEEIYKVLIGREIEVNGARQILEDDFDLTHEVKYCLDSTWRIEEDEEEQDAIIAFMNDDALVAEMVAEIRELAQKCIEDAEEE